MKGKFLLIENNADMNLQLKDKFKIVRRLKSGATVIAFAKIDRLGKKRNRLKIYKTRRGIKIKKSDIAIPLNRTKSFKKAAKYQAIKLGFMTGMHLNAINDYQAIDNASFLKITPGSSNGFLIGMLFEFPINHHFAIRISPQFGKTASKWDIQDSTPGEMDTLKTTRSIQSILFPISLKYQKGPAYIHAGFGYFNIARSTSESSNTASHRPESIDHLIDMQDITFHFGAGSVFQISPRASLFIEGQHMTLPGNMLIKPDDYFKELNTGGWSLVSGIVVQL